MTEMDDEPEPTSKMPRKLKRRAANERPANSLINHQPIKDLFGKLKWDRTFDYKAERTRKRT